MKNVYFLIRRAAHLEHFRKGSASALYPILCLLSREISSAAAHSAKISPETYATPSLSSLGIAAFFT